MTEKTRKVDKKVSRSSIRERRRMIREVLRLIAHLATLILAGWAIQNRVDDAVIWAFLGAAIGLSMRDAKCGKA